jgi:hypothetical protein
MSEMGQKATSADIRAMSALTPISDIGWCERIRQGKTTIKPSALPWLTARATLGKAQFGLKRPPGR